MFPAGCLQWWNQSLNLLKDNEEKLKQTATSRILTSKEACQNCIKPYETRNPLKPYNQALLHGFMDPHL